MKNYGAKRLVLSISQDSSGDFIEVQGLDEIDNYDQFRTEHMKLCKIFCLMQNEAFFTRTQFWSWAENRDRVEGLLAQQSIWTKDDFETNVLSLTNADEAFLFLTACKVLKQNHEANFDTSALAGMLNELSDEQLDELLDLQEAFFRTYAANEDFHDLYTCCLNGEEIITNRGEDTPDYTNALGIYLPIELPDNLYNDIGSLVKMMNNGDKAPAHKRRLINQKDEIVSELRPTEHDTLDETPSKKRKIVYEKLLERIK